MMSDALPWEPRSLTELAAWFDRLNELEDAESHPLDITDHLNRLVPILTLLVGDYELAGLDPSDVKAQAYRYKHYARWPNWKRLEIVEEHIGPLGDRLEDAIRLQAMVGESTREPSPEATDHVSDEGDDQQDAIGKLARAIVSAGKRADAPAREAKPPKSPTTLERDTYCLFHAVEAYLMEQGDVSRVKQEHVYEAAKSLLDDVIDRDEIGVSRGYRIPDKFDAFIRRYRDGRKLLAAT